MKSFIKKTSPKIRISPGYFFSRNRSWPKFREAGFTLMEMMIVVAIIGILSALAFPSLSTLIPRNRTKTAARELSGYIQKAKLEAIKQNADCLVVFTEAAGSNTGSCITCISSDDDCADADDQIISQLDFNDYNNVSLSVATFSGDKFVFNNRGIPKTTAGAMAAGRAVIQNTEEIGYSFDVVVASSGRVIIE